MPDIIAMKAGTFDTEIKRALKPVSVFLKPEGIPVGGVR